jgi:hypothetical protein
MNLSETLQLLAALKAAGVSKFKSLEHDIVLDGANAPDNYLAPAMPSQPAVSATPVVPQTLVPVNPEATKKVEDLINTLKMNDAELAAHLFPDGGAI